VYHLPILLVIFLIRVIVAASKAKSGNTSTTLALPNARELFWYLAACGGTLLAFMCGCIVLVEMARNPSPVAVGAMLLAYVAAVGGGIFAFVRTWTPLHLLARRGHFRLVYYAAQLSPLFVRTDNTRGGALLLSSLALAYAASSTEAQRAFLARRFAGEKRGGAAYGAALAMWHALEARAAREAGDAARAIELEEGAWAIFGTVTYMSTKATPLPVRRVAEEYLALDSARRGQWGGVDRGASSLHARSTTLAGRALIAFVDEKLKGKAREQVDAKVLRDLASPIVDRLFARQPRDAPRDAVEARARAGRVYANLVRREYVAPRMVLSMLATYDALLDPAFPDTVLPPEIRDDAELVSGVQESVAESIAEVLPPAGAPLFAMSRVGPVSARVHARLETTLFQEVTRGLKRLDDRRAECPRLDARAEWLEVSLVRARFRRLQQTLGDAAVARLQQRFAYSYGCLGVDLSNKAPHRRPLAHAIFHVLHGESVRAGDQVNIDLQAKNMRITEGPR
jgi:hypothetical protein